MRNAPGPRLNRAAPARSSRRLRPLLPHPAPARRGSRSPSTRGGPAQHERGGREGGAAGGRPGGTGPDGRYGLGGRGGGREGGTEGAGGPADPAQLRARAVPGEGRLRAVLRAGRGGEPGGVRGEGGAQVAAGEAAPEGEDVHGDRHPPQPGPPPRRRLPGLLRGRRLRLRRAGALPPQGEGTGDGGGREGGVGVPRC